MAKFRILKTLDSEGVAIFYPQRRFLWLWWSNFDGYSGPVCFNDYASCEKFITCRPRVLELDEVMKEFE